MTKKFSFLVMLLMTIALIISCIFRQADTTQKTEQMMTQTNQQQEQRKIIYVPGWLKGTYHHKEILQKIKEIFPNSTVEVHSWSANSLSFDKSMEEADLEAQKLATKISRLSLQEREKLILIGHSLGGRITIRTLAKLQENHLKIYQGIFLAAAIPDNDPDIAKAIHATWGPNINICNPQDVTLKYFYSTFGEKTLSPLGSSGYKLIRSPYYYELATPANITELTDISDTKFSPLNIEIVKKLASHHVVFYLETLRQQLQGEPIEQELMILQDKTNLELKVVDAEVWWVVEDEVLGWKLQKNKLFGNYRILDPDSYRRAWGGKTKMRQSFKKLKEQLKKK